MKKLILAIVAVFFLSGISLGQTNVKIIDLTAIPQVIEPDPEGEIMKVEFKIKNANEAQTAYVLFGTSDEGSEVLMAQATFHQDGGNYFIDYDGTSKQIVNYRAEILISLTDIQYSSYTHLTVYVTDINGTQTTKLKLAK